MVCRLVNEARDRGETVVTNRETDLGVASRLQPEFLKRYLDLRYEKQPAAGREVAAMPVSMIFTAAMQAGSHR
jgi:hypothetical protein